MLKKATRTTKKRQKEVQDVTKGIMKNIKARNAAVLTKEEHELIGPQDEGVSVEMEQDLGSYTHMVFGVHKWTSIEDGEECYDIMVGIEYEEQDLL